MNAVCPLLLQQYFVENVLRILHCYCKYLIIIFKTNERGNRKVKNNRQKLPGQRTIRKNIKRNKGSCGKYIKTEGYCVFEGKEAKSSGNDETILG